MTIDVGDAVVEVEGAVVVAGEAEEAREVGVQVIEAIDPRTEGEADLGVEAETVAEMAVAEVEASVAAEAAMTTVVTSKTNNRAATFVKFAGITYN